MQAKHCNQKHMMKSMQYINRKQYIILIANSTLSLIAYNKQQAVHYNKKNTVHSKLYIIKKHAIH